MNKDNIINRENFEWLLEQPVNVQLEVMQHHLDVMKIAINSVLEKEVESLAGKPYSLGNDFQRWGINPGSVRVGAQKIPVEVPRVQEKASGKFSPLPIYEQLRELPTLAPRLRQVYNVVVTWCGQNNTVSRPENQLSAYHK